MGTFRGGAISSYNFTLPQNICRKTYISSPDVVNGKESLDARNDQRKELMQSKALGKLQQVKYCY